MLEQPSNRRFGMHTRHCMGWRPRRGGGLLIPHTWRFRYGRLARHLRGARYPIRRRIGVGVLAAAPLMGHTGRERCARPSERAGCSSKGG